MDRRRHLQHLGPEVTASVLTRLIFPRRRDSAEGLSRLRFFRSQRLEDEFGDHDFPGVVLEVLLVLGV